MVIFFVLLISPGLGEPTLPLVSDNYTGSGQHGAVDTDGTDPAYRPAAVMSWSDKTMVSGLIKNFQKSFRYESGFMI
ncbi:MAG: hypothetical protein LUQ50_12635 [Methanospirillum sp.]|uniref:hypothetical protein n=1 Tax=Methanospirillum sp. TaxID=45200 RepID=UPI00236AFF12|nr:hypothetical protein [Methanospirillum sp.]MDD1729903.1 hypothetical protein [Methanospirillum sp.]